MSVCRRVAFCGSYGRDNGEAGAEGQPPRRAFPKAFVWLMAALRNSIASVRPRQGGDPLPLSVLGVEGGCHAARTRGRGVQVGALAATTRGSDRSALLQRLDLLVEFLERGLALDLLAIDEERRRRIDLQHIIGVFL